jgi:hypothetical protein
VRNVSYKPHVAKNIGILLNELRKSNPKNYSILRNEFFPDFFGLKSGQVDALADLNPDSAGVVFIGRHGKIF